jgi:hypothetical protein
MSAELSFSGGMNKGRDRGVIDPRTNAFMPYWDILMVVLVAFTATVTPYETAFVEEPNVIRDGPNAMWILNRVVDACFMLDILLTCNTMYELQGLQHGSWVGRRSLIVARYLRSPWFVVDIVSVFPWWVFNLLPAPSASPGGANGSAAAALLAASGGSGSESESLDSLRLVKLLRMLKLARMLKAAEYFAPFVKDVIMVRLEFTYAALKVFELFMWLFLFTHLQACFWGLLSGLSDDGVRPTWIRAYSASYEETWGVPPQPWEVYVSAVYWSAMTVTSIGYGEMLPENSAERIACTFFMLLSGMVWTYILSNAAGIAATLNPNAVLFQNTMCARAPFSLHPAFRAYSEHFLRLVPCLLACVTSDSAASSSRRLLLPPLASSIHPTTTSFILQGPAQLLHARAQAAQAPAARPAPILRDGPPRA